MKKRVFLAAGVAVLSAAVLAACSSGNANKEANKPVTYESTEKIGLLLLMK